MRWIPLKEEIPPFNVSVLVYCTIYGRYLGYFKQIEGTDLGVWCNWANECGLLPPTHWMALPDPPQVIDKDDFPF